MAKFDKIAVLSKMEESKIVPIFYNSDVEICKQVVRVCYQCGIRVFEFTNRADSAHNVFSEVCNWCKEECPDLAIGVGSVVDDSTAALYIQLGACFIVGPLFNASVAKICNRRQVPYIPGCGTATEIGMAQEYGCEVVKLFPGSVYGNKMVKDILAPMPWTKIMVTGGVSTDSDNISSWFNAGAFCIGIGSNLFSKDIIKTQDWNSLSNRCRTIITAVKCNK